MHSNVRGSCPKNKHEQSKAASADQRGKSCPFQPQWETSRLFWTGQWETSRLFWTGQWETSTFSSRPVPDIQEQYSCASRSRAEEHVTLEGSGQQAWGSHAGRDPALPPGLVGVQGSTAMGNGEEHCWASLDLKNRKMRGKGEAAGRGRSETTLHCRKTGLSFNLIMRLKIFSFSLVENSLF